MLLHCVVDAILGALELLGIGQIFLVSDSEWKGAPSSVFIKEAVSLCLMKFSLTNKCEVFFPILGLSGVWFSKDVCFAEFICLMMCLLVGVCNFTSVTYLIDHEGYWVLTVSQWKLLLHSVALRMFSRDCLFDLKLTFELGLFLIKYRVLALWTNTGRWLGSDAFEFWLAHIP